MKSFLASISPTNIGIERVLLVALKVYLDGSKSPGRFITLSAIAADDATWLAIEGAWNRVTAKHGAPPIHMHALMSLEGDFKHWNPPDRECLLDGLIAAFNEFIDNSRIKSFTCTVDLKAHCELKDRRNLPVPEKICARIVVGQIWQWYLEFPDKIITSMQFYFDRNERFRRHVYADWKCKQLVRCYPAWGLITAIGEAKMNSEPALQMVDMIAWSRNFLLCNKFPNDSLHHRIANKLAVVLNGAWSEVAQDSLSTMIFADEGYDLFGRPKSRLATR